MLKGALVFVAVVLTWLALIAGVVLAKNVSWFAPTIVVVALTGLMVVIFSEIIGAFLRKRSRRKSQWPWE